jgi:hypothetical protein
MHRLLEAVHVLYTHTLFYFAQVHGNLGDSELSSKNVERTLQRQLDFESSVPYRERARKVRPWVKPAVA